jgi:hypothetical protein
MAAPTQSHWQETGTTNGGAFTYGTSSVTLDSYDLTKSESTADTLTFEAGKTTTIADNGTVTLNGADSQLLTLTSINTWYFVVRAATTNKTIKYVDVANSDASGSHADHKPIDPANSVDSGNNIEWFTGGSVSPATPTNESVTNADSRRPTLAASAFNDSGDTHQASQWQISTASGAGFDAAIVYDTGTVTAPDLVSHTVVIPLDANTDYYWHVRYQDTNDNAWSNYSDSTVQSFTTGLGLPANAVAYWKLDENGGTSAADSVGSNTGTIYADASSTPGATWVTGRSGSAVDFDNDYNRILGAYNEQGGLLDYHTAHTLEAWIKWDGSNDRDLVFAEGAGSHGYQLSIIGGTDQFNFAIRSSSALEEIYVSTSMVPINQWIHVAGTYDGAAGELRLYINGGEVASQTTGIPTSIGNATYGWHIGGARVAYDVQADSSPGPRPPSMAPLTRWLSTTGR